MDHFQDVIKGAKQLLKNMPDPIYIVNLDDEIIWVNDAFHFLFGNRNSKFAGFMEKKVPINNASDETIAFSVQLKENTSVQSVEKYRIIAENTLDTIVLMDSDAIVQYVSPSIKSLVGYDVEEYERMDAFHIIHPDDQDRVRVLHSEVFRSRQPVNMEYRLIHSQGHTVHIEARVKPVLDDKGQVKYAVAVARDVTERKQKEHLLENILDNVNAGVMSTDKDFSRMTFCSDSIGKMFGFSIQEITASPILLHTHMHPEDDAALMHEVKHQLDLGIPVVKTFRLLHGEETKWIKMTIHPYLDYTGAIERFDGILMDVTEKKLSELALEESEQRYKSLFENNLDGVFSIDLNGFYFVNANRSFERITGTQFDKLNDRCFMGLIMDEDHASVFEALFHVIQQQESRDIECRISKSAYGEKIVSITFVPIFLSDQLNGIHGIVKDITQRKREERELIQSEERYKVLQQSINRFSNDLANVMKVSVLESRLIDEVKSVLNIDDVSIEEVPRGQEQSLMSMGSIWIKIGEKQQPVYLRICMDKSMLKIEEEWLETAVHYVTILYDNLHLIEDLMRRLEEMVAKMKRQNGCYDCCLIYLKRKDPHCPAIYMIRCCKI
ncbi:PAS domain S-box protein [Paenibacillus alginolyticus]|uniref:histidine kinase n=1 Tax=Paenibacillus alginolyticus TaxID=59839 RepID=A0ABT4GPS7_9BACL|nr:PAS domain S-box protein [Paenibacillus alginolyticus]MCY9698004.1 PAS domain S-box protein [Paenibacillus alginolyticus]MEC0148457.1 PAS domain S-box protein [Paenibacillus alginolyticus]